MHACMHTQPNSYVNNNNSVVIMQLYVMYAYSFQYDSVLIT